MGTVHHVVFSMQSLIDGYLDLNIVLYIDFLQLHGYTFGINMPLPLQSLDGRPRNALWQ